MKKKIIYITIFVLSVILIANSYAKISIIDSILGLFGISGWSQENNKGLHISLVILLVSLVVGYFGTVKLYEREGKNVSKNMIILSIVFWIMFPFLSKGLMMAFYYNSTSLSSIQVTESTCRFQNQDDNGMVQLNCDLTLFNFGKLKEVELKPVLKNSTDEPVDVSFNSETLPISGHSEILLGSTFTADFSEVDFPPLFLRNVDFEVALAGKE